MSAETTTTENATPEHHDPGHQAPAHGGARPVSPIDLLRGVPDIIPDLPQVLRGLVVVNTVRRSHRRSIGRAFQHAARRHPERPFLRFHGEDVSYGEANRRVNRIAEVLTRHGVRRGDTVGLCTTNRPEAVLCMLAIVKLGAAAGEGPSTVQRALLKATSADTVRTRVYSGKPARLLKTKWTQAWEAPGAPDALPMPLQNLLVSQAHQRISVADDPEVVAMPAGQIVGRMNEIKPVAESMAELVAEYEATIKRLGPL